MVDIQPLANDILHLLAGVQRCHGVLEDHLHLGHLLETGTTEEIFEHPIHPYTRSLLSAIPLPNPVVEKRRVAETYDYATSGIDYSKGTSHHVEGSHYVKCTDEEFARWCK